MEKALAYRKRMRHHDGMTKDEPRRGGAPRKTPDGFTANLYVRCEPALLARLDKYAGVLLPRQSRADVVRAMLMRCLDEAGGAAPKRTRKGTKL